MKILTLGNGFIASHLPYEIAHHYLIPSKSDIDNFLNRHDPDVIINATGFCGVPNVDQCEIEKTKTYMSNVVVPLMLAEECNNRKIHLIHIGSGCVYFGKSPNCYRQQTDQGKHNPSKKEKEGDWIEVDSGWEEADFANPQSYYAKTKYSTDLVLGQMPLCTILRLRMPISEQNTPRNLINKLRKYKQIINIPNSVTFMDDLTKCIEWAVQNRPTGIFHVVQSQPLTAARIMNEFQKYVPEHQFELISEQQLDQLTVAKRSNCLLSTKKLSAAGFEMTDSEKALAKCMANYVKNMRRNNVE
jgi:UDP-glucose 4,6-dehydratase